MRKADFQKLLELPAAERIELAQMLWDSLEPEEETGFLVIPRWQRQILDERIADFERHPEDEQAWEEVKAEIWPES